MTEPAENTYANRPVAGSDVELLEIPPASGWVVHLIASPRSGVEEVWAWCKVYENAPGYAEVVYTRTDGVTHVEPPHTQLGPVVFKAFC